MELKGVIGQVKKVLIKHRYSVLILAVGIVLMLLPTNFSKKENAEVIPTEAKDQTQEEQLASILGKIEGAGRVEVMLTVVTGEEIIYQTNDEETNDEALHKNNKDTVTVTDSNRNQTGLIRQINPPVYLGAVIICQGADNPSVHLAIVDAVSKATGLTTNKISVLKMN